MFLDVWRRDQLLRIIPRLSLSLSLSLSLYFHEQSREIVDASADRGPRSDTFHRTSKKAGRGSDRAISE